MNTALPTLNDLVWTPARWVQDFSDPRSVSSLASVSFSLSDSMRQAVQTAPVSIATAFSGIFPQVWQTVYPGALEFDCPYYLEGGHTLTVSLTPTFSLNLIDVDLRQFRVVGVFDGCKTVRA